MIPRAGGILLPLALLLLLPHVDALGVVAQDAPLRIEGPAGAEGARVAHLRLQSVDAKGNLTLVLLPGNLTRASDGLVLGRHHVSAPEVTLPEGGRPVDVPVTVKGVTRPGNYTGTLQGYVAASEGEDTARVPAGPIVTVQIRLVVPPADPRVRLEGGADALRIDLVRCGTSFPPGLLRNVSCALADLVLPHASDSERRIHLENPSEAPLDLTGARLRLVDATGALIAAEAIGVRNGSGRVAPHDFKTLNLSWDPSRVPAGAYNGTLQVHLDEGAAVVVPVRVRVREGPLVPLVLILVGFLLAKAALWTRTRGKAEREALGAIAALRRDLRALPAEDQRALEARLAQLEWDVGGIASEKLPERTKELAERLELVRKAHALETKAGTMPGATDLAKRASGIRAEARTAADLKDAQARLQTAAKELQTREEVAEGLLVALEDLAAADAKMHPDDRQAVKERAEALREKARELRTEGLKEEVADLRARRELLRKAWDLEQLAPSLRPPVPEAAKHASRARQMALGASDITLANDEYEAAKAALNGPTEGFTLLDVLKRAPLPEQPIIRGEPPAESPSFWQGAAVKLRRLRAKAVPALAWTAWMAGVLLVAYAGLRMYADELFTFGAHPLLDVVGLLIWGGTTELTSDVLKRLTRR